MDGEPFSRANTGIFTNTTCFNKDYESYKNDYDYKSYFDDSFATNGLVTIVKLVGVKIAKQALNLSGNYFDDASNIAKNYGIRGNTTKREILLYNEEKNTLWNTGDTNFRQFQSFLYKVNGLSANLIEAEYGLVNTSTQVMKDAWELAGSSKLGKASGLIGTGLAFKSVEAQKKCKSTFIFNDKNFNIVSPSVASDLVYLIGVIPRTKGTGTCRTNTGNKEIIEEIAQGISLAGERAMTMYCLTVTGTSGWFGFNDWYGQIKIMSIKSHQKITMLTFHVKNILIATIGIKIK